MCSFQKIYIHIPDRYTHMHAQAGNESCKAMHILKDDAAAFCTVVCQQWLPAEMVAWGLQKDTHPHATDRSSLYRSPDCT